MALILLVDDFASNREFFVNVLGQKGHRLLEAGDGPEALALAENLRPDLIIADILMPTMDGFEFVGQLRGAPSTASIPLIFCAAHYLQRETHDLARACVHSYVLVKPCEPEQVLYTVDRALGLTAFPAPSSDGIFDAERLRLMTGQLTQKEEDLNAANRRLAALIDVSLRLISQTDPKNLANTVCRAARELIGCKYAAACLSQGDIFATSGLDAEMALALRETLPSSLLILNLEQTRRACRHTSLSGEPKALGFPAQHPPVHSFMAAPVVSPTANYGWLCVVNKLGGDAFNDESERILSILTAKVARIYENQLLYNDVQRKAAELERQISERKKAEAEVRELNARLERRVLERTAELQAANKELEAFSYSISHDLRAPLRHISGYVELLKLAVGPELEEKPRDFLDKIAGSADQMGQLVEDLLEFSRMARAEVCHENVNLNGLLETARSRLEQETKDRNIQWKICPLPAVQADAALLLQVFINLIANAVKYTRPRNPAEIEIGTQNGSPDEIVIFVRDNGVGFDMEFAGKLFGVFQRLHTPEEFEGTGIGLANVRRIITRHGGRTWAEGKPGKGATFYFSLPIAAAPAK